MGNAARKARKRAGEKFERTAKVGTPIEERAIQYVSRKVGDKLVSLPSNRELKRRERREVSS